MGSPGEQPRHRCCLNYAQPVLLGLFRAVDTRTSVIMKKAPSQSRLVNLAHYVQG
jgi:hypothetical protein